MATTKIMIEIEVESNTPTSVDVRVKEIIRRSTSLTKGLNCWWKYGWLYDAKTTFSIKTLILF